MSAPRVNRALIANRGEIAVRIIRACQSLGITTIAVYSDADRHALHVSLADESVHIGPESATDSYLSIDKIIDAARSSQADAVHPGYGFLSENPAFVERCEAAGLTFIGPGASAMRALGDKARAKQLAQRADVPTVPQWEPEAVPADAYPVLVKAAAGGGGRGMRRVDRAEDLAEALESAAREAKAGFGDDTLIIEKLVTGARHIEVQLLSDAHGNHLAIGDRDCSLQRRHQKVVEEAPAPNLHGDLRRAMADAVVRLAREAGYVNAGTAEFLVSADQSAFYFLELNARLQVEHPVTEAAFGIDLVQWQLRIARGEELTLEQSSLVVKRCAIEARVYAEDPVSFLPTGGEIALVELPHGEHVRVDHALVVGSTISLAYDPLLAKVIATGATRDDARSNLLDALRELVILGAVTNTHLLQHSVQVEAFVDATHTVETLESNLLDAQARIAPPHVVTRARKLGASAADPFHQLSHWRSSVDSVDAARVDDSAMRIHTFERGDRLWISADGITWDVPRSSIDAALEESGASIADADHASLTAPMPGTVIRTTPPGTRVAAGDPVVVLEAMKMENAITAPFEGTVEIVGCTVGELVTKGSVLAEVVR